MLIIFNLIYCTYLGWRAGEVEGGEGSPPFGPPAPFLLRLSVSAPPPPPHPLVVWMWFYFLSVSSPLPSPPQPLCSYLPTTLCLLLFLGLLYNSTCIHCVHTTSQTKTQQQTLYQPAGVPLSCGVWVGPGVAEGERIWSCNVASLEAPRSGQAGVVVCLTSRCVKSATTAPP